MNTQSFETAYFNDIAFARGETGGVKNFPKLVLMKMGKRNFYTVIL